MKTFYKTEQTELYNADCLEALKGIDENSVDCLITDPPYGYSFMSKAWDAGVPCVEIWAECLRVMKPGAFAFIMSAPRQDVQAQMIVNLRDAGFRLDFSPLYWAYASGFPKAHNISKAIDKKADKNEDVVKVKEQYKKYLNKKRREAGLTLNKINELLNTATNGGGVASALMGNKPKNEIGTWSIHCKLKEILNLDDRFDCLIEDRPSNYIEAEREVIAEREVVDIRNGHGRKYGGAMYAGERVEKMKYKITTPATEQAIKYNGSYGGFQPKPAVEVVLVAMKPLDEKTFVDQCLKNGKGVTWLDSVRIPYESDDSYESNCNRDNVKSHWNNSDGSAQVTANTSGRFPANLLVSDDVLNDGVVHTRGELNGQPRTENNAYGKGWNKANKTAYKKEAGTFSRYFSLDAWYSHKINIKALPPAAQKTFPFLISAKASKAEKNAGCEGLQEKHATALQFNADDSFKDRRSNNVMHRNNHPTCKPLKLMSYLITLGSRTGDTVIDPFTGSGTTGVSCNQLNRKFIGIEREQEYCKIAKCRIENEDSQIKLSL